MDARLAAGGCDAREVFLMDEKPAPLTPLQWLIGIIAAIGFAFDSYVLLMLPLIVRPALIELLHVPPNSPAINDWVGIIFYVPAVAGGIFGLLGGYLTDILGRRRVLVWSILLYAFSAFASGYSTSVMWLLFWRWHVRRRVRRVRRRGGLAVGTVSQSQAARVDNRLHASRRIVWGHDGHGCLLPGGDLRRTPAAGAWRPRSVALYADVRRHPGDSADRDPSVPA